MEPYSVYKLLLTRAHMGRNRRLRHACAAMLYPHYNACYLCPDATIRPMTPCERARYAATHGPIGAYIPTCDAAGRYTPKQCSGSTG